MQVHYGEDRGLEVPDEDYLKPEEYTCSDCSPHLNDVELMKKHVDAKYLSWATVRLNPNCYAQQIVSPDGTKIYFQKGAQSDEVALFELDIGGGTERELAAFPGSCAQIDRMRPRPIAANSTFN